MKVKKIEIVKHCDICNKEAYTTCLSCGKDYCNKHENIGVEYQHSINFGGSDDGFFCNECDIEITNNTKHPLYQLHESYKEIDSLRKKAKAYYDQLEKNGNEAEQKLKYWIKQTKNIVKS